MFNRIIKGVFSSFYGQGVTILFQLISVPLFITSWGLDKYGYWLTIFAIPMTLTILDFGFFNIIGNKISKYIIEEKYLEANNVINVVLKYISILFFCISILLLLYESLNFEGSGLLLIFLLVFYSFFVLITNFIVSIFRANLQFHIGSFLSNTARLIESIAVLSVLYFHASMLEVTIVYLFMRFLSLILIIWKFKSNIDWYSFKFEVNYTVNRDDIKDSFNYAFLPIAFMLNNQGLIFVINSIYGSAQVAIFVTIRTYFRLLNQFVSALTNSIWQEINYLFNKDKYAELNKMMKKIILIIISSSVFIGCFLFLAIEPILALWTKNAIKSDFNINALILLSVLLFAFWQPFHVFLSSIGRHKWHAKLYFTLQVMLLTLSYYLACDFNCFLILICSIEAVMFFSTLIIYKKNIKSIC